MSKKIIFIYLIIASFFALNSYKDYGISWDEGMQRRTAQINFDYIFNNNNELKTWIDRDYGIAFELPLYMLEKIFKWEKPNGDERSVFIYRHLFTHLFYIIGGVFLFLLISQLFNSNLYGIISLFLYILNPRIYAHSFINTKDIPLMVFFIICFYFFYRFIKKRTVINILLVGLTSAILINTRILGIIFPVGVISYLLFFDFFDGEFNKLKRTFSLVVIFSFSTVLLTYILWPNLWDNPINNFIEAFQNMSKFRHNPSELVFGEMIKASEDKSYFFKWFFTTNPLGYLILGILGFILLKVSFYKKEFLKDENNRLILFFSSFFIIPLLIIILRNSVLYNSWRQLFFIYPSFIILILFSLQFLKKKKYYYLILIGFLVYVIKIYVNQIQLHPYQNIYFNELVRKEKNYIVKNFEFDYWGHSYKQALEEIAKNNLSDSISFATSEYVGALNLKILLLKDRERLYYVENINNADYFISNFYSDDIKFNQEKLYFSVKRYNNSVISVFKLK